MITVSKKVEYCIILIGHLAKKQQKVVSLAQVSQELLLPYRFLGQLATTLKLAGIIESREGKRGGYCLAADWQTKTLYDLLDSLGENKHMVTCLGDKDCHRAKMCGVKSIWSRLENSLTAELKKIKLTEI